MKKNWLGPIVMLAAVVLVLGVLRARLGGVAETPPSFAAHTSLDAALQQSEQSGKPVLALVTADWCGPCQMLKRGALVDKGVEDWIDRHAIPAYVDGTNDKTERFQHERRLLGIRAFPTLVLLDHGEEVSRRTGVVSAGEMLEWLEGSGVGG